MRKSLRERAFSRGRDSSQLRPSELFKELPHIYGGQEDDPNCLIQRVAKELGISNRLVHKEYRGLDAPQGYRLRGTRGKESKYVLGSFDVSEWRPAVVACYIVELNTPIAPDTVSGASMAAGQAMDLSPSQP